MREMMMKISKMVTAQSAEALLKSLRAKRGNLLLRARLLRHFVPRNDIMEAGLLNKKSLLGILFLCAFSLTSNVAFCYTSTPIDDSRNDVASGMSRKLGRGVANASLGWIEVFKGMQDVSDENGFWAGATWGPIYGTVNAVRRTAAGLYETATFPLPGPSKYEPVVEPEFVLGSNS